MACRRRWRKSSPPTATAISSSRSAAIVDADLERLTEIAAVLDRVAEPYFVSLDGNEQYDDVEGIARAVAPDAGRRRRCRRLVAGILFIEQPIKRAHALDSDVSALARASSR